MKTFLVLLSSVVCATAYICCPPSQWEGYIGETGGYVTDSKSDAGYISAYIVYHIDREMKKIAFDSQSTVGPTQSNVHTLQDFDKKIQYQVEGGVCTKSALQGSIEDNACVTDRAQLQGKVDIVGMLANSYTYTAEGIDMNVTLTVWEKGCIPCGFNAVIHSQGAHSILNGGYFNITTGIKDPSVFDVPAACKGTMPFKKLQGLFLEPVLHRLAFNKFEKPQN
ncbi:ependymin-related protein 1-like [Ptychodera flava]|uniref:ependymin-related protein 1-like n=1 Tax=Ptychodera flava TaxID=63121 RepID=UPI00396AB020